MFKGKNLLWLPVIVSMSGCVPPSMVGQVVQTVGSQAANGALSSTSAPATRPQTTATAKANVNIREVPKGKKLGVFHKGNQAVVLAENNGWVQIQEIRDGGVTGWVSGKYVTKSTLPTTVQSPAASGGLGGFAAALSGVTGAGTASGKAATMPFDSDDFFKTGKVYKGYSKDFKSVNDLIQAGEFVKARDLYKKGGSDKNTPKIDMESDSLLTLHNLQLGSLNLDAGKPEESIQNFKASRTKLNMESDEAIVASGFKTAGLFAAEFLSGNEELQPYDPVGYEKVMMLNYNALAYLVNGDSKAFNVARRAADWQSMERKKFEKSLQEAQEKLKAEKKNLSDTSARMGGAENPFSMSRMDKSLRDAYAKYDKRADKVASAYVNPFSDYLIGMVMEYKALNDPSKLDDARRHYKRAHKLNKRTRLLPRAVKEMDTAVKKGQANKKSMLLHVVVADGVAPEKKVLTNMIPVPEAIVTLNLPLIEPVESRVAKVKLKTTSGKTLQTLDTIADIEAMALRYQKDIEPQLMFRAVSSVVRNVVEQKALGSALGGLGQVIGAAKGQLSHPDTRAWSNLPSNMKAARLYLPMGTKEVVLESYDVKGRKLASERIKLNPKGHNLIYARSVDEHMQAYTAANLWVNR